MNTKEINAKLKEIGFGFVKVNTPTSWDIDSGACHTNWEGKRSKGIRGGSIGPMTMTNAHQNHNKEIEDKLRNMFYDYYSFKEGSSLLTFDDGKKTRTYKFDWSLYPSNTKAMDLDEGYQTYWYTPSVTDKKNHITLEDNCPNHGW